MEPRLYKARAFSSAQQWDERVGRELDRALESIVQAKNAELMGKQLLGVFRAHQAGASKEVAPKMLISLRPDGTVVPASALDPERPAHGIVLSRVSENAVIWIAGGTIDGCPTPVGAGAGSRYLLLGTEDGTMRTTDVNDPQAYYQQVGLLVLDNQNGTCVIDLNIAPPASY